MFSVDTYLAAGLVLLANTALKKPKLYKKWFGGLLTANTMLLSLAGLGYFSADNSARLLVGFFFLIGIKVLAENYKSR